MDRRHNIQTQTTCVVVGTLLRLGVVRPANYSPYVATESVGTSDVVVHTSASGTQSLSRDPKAFEALQLHYGGLSHGDAMVSSDSDGDDYWHDLEEAVGGDYYGDGCGDDYGDHGNDYDYGHDDDHFTYG
jgi:hypothetical protein